MIKKLKGVVRMAFYNLAKRRIDRHNYATKKDMIATIEGFAKKGLITEEQKVELLAHLDEKEKEEIPVEPK